MASALAHELNQPLAAISNYMKGSRRLLAPAPIPTRRKSRARSTAPPNRRIRAGQIIRRLRDFVARGESEKRVESLSKLIEEAGALGLTGAREQGVPASLQSRSGPATWCWPIGSRSSRCWSICFRNALEAMAQFDRSASSSPQTPRRRTT